MTRSGDDGFTLVETAVVVGIAALVIAAIGVRSLAGPSVAVAAAADGVVAAFDEARRTAIALDAATVVVAPRAAGNGFAVRVYRRIPGDPAFAPANGPDDESDVSAAEDAAPLGPPGFAFSIDRRGGVTGYAAFDPAAATFDRRACPASGAFAIELRSGPQQRHVTVPCTIALAGGAPAVFFTAPPAVTPPPVPTPAIACASGAPCPLPTLAAANPAYALNVNPAAIAIAANQPFAFTATDAASSGPPGAVAISAVQGGCDALTIPAGTWMPSGTSFGGVGRSGTCTIAVTDSAGNAATVTVTVAPAHPQVQDQCNVALGVFVYTDTGTSPPTDHLGNGQPCGGPTPAPSPTAAPPAIVEMDRLVAYNCAGNGTCWQIDAALEYLLSDGNATTTVTPAQVDAFAARVSAGVCSFPAPARGGAFVQGVDYADTAYAMLYQEATDNGIGGYVAVSVTVCPP
jgi:type II secretory pathway pseudopilin PulG